MRRLLVAVLSLSVSALGGASAHADAPKKAPTDDLGKKSATITPDKSLAGDVTRKKVVSGPVGPAKGLADAFGFQVQLQVASKRHEQIEYLQKIIQLGAEDTEMPKLLFRLAELYWEENKYYFFEANRKDDDIFAAKDKGDEDTVAKLTDEKKELVDKSQKYQDAAVEDYRKIVSGYPKFDRMDEVLYFLGHNLWDSNKEDDALGIYKILITKYPKSKYIPDSWLAFGEYYFNGSKGNQDMIRKALESYKRAAEHRENSVFAYAMYKEAWCQFNLNDFPAAGELFHSVITLGDKASSGKGDKRTALAKEARKDYVLNFSRYGEANGAEDDFKRVGGSENWRGMLKGLAGLYYDDGKDKEAAYVYHRLIQIEPLSPEAPLFQSRIVDAVMRVGKKDMVLAQVRALVKIVGEVEKANKNPKEEDKKSLAEARDLSERAMSNLAVNWQVEARKTRDEPTFTYANEVYSDYLTIFPDSKKSYDLRFFWAELLNDNLQKFDKAAEQYTKVVEIDAKKIEAGTKPGKWLKNAVLDAVLANDEVVKKANEPLPQADAKKASPIPPAKQALIVACDNYLKFLPKGDKTTEISYKEAKIFYDYNHLDEAQKRFDDICQNHPEHETAEYACNLVLDIENLREDLPGVFNTAKKYLSNDALVKAHPKLAKELKELLEKTSFKLVSGFEKEGKFYAAAKKYLGYVEQFPHGSLSDTALLNASIDLYKAHHFEEALAIRHRLIKEFPTSKFVPEALYNNAEASESVGDFEAAAEGYEDYTRRYQKQSGMSGAPKPAAHASRGKHGKAAPVKPTNTASDQHYDESKAQNGLFNAGVFREGLGQIKQALADRQLYLELWPEAKDAEQVYLSIASLYEKQSQGPKAINEYMDYEKKNIKSPEKLMSAEAKIERILEKSNKKAAVKKREDMLKYYSKLTAAQKAKIEGLALERVALATYEEVEPKYVDYVKLKFKLNLADPKGFKKAIGEKGDRLKDLQKKYTDVVNLKVGGPAICALARIGDLYANFEEALNNVAMPKGLNQEQQDGIREGLQAQSDPLHAKSGEAYKLAVDKSRELSVYNSCSERALNLLADKYAPENFPKITEDLAEVKPDLQPKNGSGFLSSIQPIPSKDDESDAADAQPADQGSGDSGGDKPAGAAASPEGADDHPPAEAPPGKTVAASKPPPADGAPDPAPKGGDEPGDEVAQ